MNGESSNNYIKEIYSSRRRTNVGERQECSQELVRYLCSERAPSLRGGAAPPAVYKERRQAPSLRPFTNFIAWFNCFEWDASHGGGGWPPLIDNPLSSRHNQGETISKKFTFSVYPLLLLFDHRHHVYEIDHGHHFRAKGLRRCGEKLVHNSPRGWCTAAQVLRLMFESKL